MEYLDLHNLTETEQPYTVARVIDDELQASPECQLPSYTPLVLSLPDLDVTMPDMDCKFDVNVPLVPLPYTCSPTLSGGITVTSTGTAPILINNTIGFNKINQCDYQLDGELDLQLNVACAKGYTSDRQAISLQVGPKLVQSGSLTLTQDGCEFGLASDLKIELSAFCVDGPIVEPDFANITADDPLSVTGRITISAVKEECSIGIDSDVNISLDCDKIGFDLDGSLNTQFDIVVTIGSGDSKGNLGIYSSGTGCSKRLQANPVFFIHIPMEEYNVAVCNGDAEETVTLYKKIG